MIMKKTQSGFAVVGVAIAMVALLAGSAYVFRNAGTSDDLVAQVSKAVTGKNPGSAGSGSATKPPSTASTTPPKLPSCVLKPVDCSQYEKAVIDAQEALDSLLLELQKAYRTQGELERKLADNRIGQRNYINEATAVQGMLDAERRDVANIQEEITSVQRRLMDPRITPQKKAQLEQILRNLQNQLEDAEAEISLLEAELRGLYAAIYALEERERRLQAELDGTNEYIKRLNIRIDSAQAELDAAKRRLETCRKLERNAFSAYLKCLSNVLSKIK